jgi:hypothetical protein
MTRNLRTYTRGGALGGALFLRHAGQQLCIRAHRLLYLQTELPSTFVARRFSISMADVSSKWPMTADPPFR